MWVGGMCGGGWGGGGGGWGVGGGTKIVITTTIAMTLKYFTMQKYNLQKIL